MSGQMRNLARAAVLSARAAASEAVSSARPLAPPKHPHLLVGTVDGSAWSSASSLTVAHQLQHVKQRGGGGIASMMSRAAPHAGARGVGLGVASGGGRGGGMAVASRCYSSGAPRATVGQGPVGWISLAMVCITGGGLLYYYEMERARRLEAIKAGPSAGKASIGGPFKLQNANENGKNFSTTQLHGKFALLYFGFTMVRGPLIRTHPVARCVSCVCAYSRACACVCARARARFVPVPVPVPI